MGNVSRFTTWCLFCLVAGLLVTGCADSNGPPNVSTADKIKATVKIGYTVPQYTNSLTAGITDTLVRYARIARLLAGTKPESTSIPSGTLRITDEGSGTGVYSPTPTDRFVLISSDGSQREFHAATFSMGADLYCNYDMDFTFTTSTGARIRWTEHRRDDVIECRATGTIRFDGIVYNVDIQQTNTRTAQIAGGANDTILRKSIVGTVSNSDCALTLNENHVDSVTQQSGVTTTFNTRTLTNKWIYGANDITNYEGTVRTMFTNGRPDWTVNNWEATGSISYNANAFGELRCQVRGTAVELWTDSPVGQIVLDTWQL